MRYKVELKDIYKELEEKRKRLETSFPSDLGLRVRRAISWIGRAARADDDDGKFIFLWIAFNSAYADEQEFDAGNRGDWKSLGAYFDKVVDLDKEQRIHEKIWNNFSKSIRLLMKNEFLYWRFWKYQKGIAEFHNWKEFFDEELKKFNKKIVASGNEKSTKKALTLMFGRLNVLRNQLVHGGATWNSDVNRNQVRDGTAILAFLIPVFVDVMMSHPSEDWGQPFYPVVSSNSPLSGQKQ